MTVVSDDYRGSIEILEWRRGSAVRRRSALRFGDPRPGTSVVLPALARAPDGTAAAVPTSEYAVVRLDTAFQLTDVIKRSVERQPRTATEREVLRSRLVWRVRALRATEGPVSGASSGRGTGTSLLDQPTPPLMIDPLRFDETGRLWVHTQRGTQSRSVFDLFDTRGAFLSEVLVPGRLTAWGVGAGRLVGATTDVAGFPVVVVRQLG